MEEAVHGPFPVLKDLDTRINIEKILDSIRRENLRRKRRLARKLMRIITGEKILVITID